jgi:methylated-DNA-[protein]-cysteine S-methyltransferase
LKRFTLPWALPTDATPFARAVWQATAAIPYGETRTYGELARAAGSPGAARAVGGAMAKNPLPLVIPCHRVVGAGGRIGGFSPGVSLKRCLLAHEGHPLTHPA